MLILAVCALVVASPLVAGRWPANLVLHRWRWTPLIWGALLVQVLIMQFNLATAAAPVLHVFTYVVVLLFLWLNRSLPGALFVGVGALSNGLTIALNGGVLPANAAAVESAGLTHGEGFDNSAVLTNPILPWLGDVFAWPAPLPLSNTFSVGDVLLVVGVAVATWSGTQRLGRAVPRDSAERDPASLE